MDHLVLSHINNLVDFRTYVILSNATVSEDFFIKNQSLSFFDLQVYKNGWDKGILLKAKKEGFFIEKDSDDNILSGIYINGLYEGVWKKTSPNGQLINETTYLKDYSRGPYVSYRDGVINSKGWYINGNRERIWTLYKNGIPFEKREYLNGFQIGSPIPL